MTHDVILPLCCDRSCLTVILYAYQFNHDAHIPGQAIKHAQKGLANLSTLRLSIILLGGGSHRMSFNEEYRATVNALGDGPDRVRFTYDNRRGIS